MVEETQEVPQFNHLTFPDEETEMWKCRKKTKVIRNTLVNPNHEYDINFWFEWSPRSAEEWWSWELDTSIGQGKSPKSS